MSSCARPRRTPRTTSPGASAEGNPLMNDRHLSTQFDAELSGISTRVLEMGGMVESQVARAVHALVTFSSEIASEVLATEERVNQTEVEIDLDLSTIIARRQPTARDLRLLIAISKTIANLERVGDEAARIARTVQRLVNSGVSTRLRLPVNDLVYEAELAVSQLRKALDAFARLDVDRAGRRGRQGRRRRRGRLRLPLQPVRGQRSARPDSRGAASARSGCARRRG